MWARFLFFSLPVIKYAVMFESLDVLDPSVRERLEDTYNHLSQNKPFPKGYCSMASEFTADERFLFLSKGFFVTDRIITSILGTRRRQPHYWTEDPEKRIIDMTAPHFNDGLIEKLPSGILVIPPTSFLYRRYIKLNENGRVERILI